MPPVDGNLAGDDERAFIVTVLDDFEEITRLVGRERLGAPVVQDEQLDAGEGAQDPGVARVAVGDGQIGEQPGDAGVENGDVFSARLVAERASKPAFAKAARPGDQQVASLGDPVAGGEFEEEGAVEPEDPDNRRPRCWPDGAGGRPWHAFRTASAGAASVHIRGAGQAIRRDRGRASALCSCSLNPLARS